MPDWLDPETGYSFLGVAAADARAESRRYWQKGGEADRRFPVNPDVLRNWPLGSDHGGPGSEDARLRRQRRERRA